MNQECTDPLGTALVINLAGASGAKRRAQMLSEFTREGIRETMRLIPATVGASILRVNKTQMWGESAVLGGGRFWPPQQPNMYALSLSHRSTYDVILQNNIPCATIFEDDIRLVEGFARAVRALSLHNADLVQLETCGCKPKEDEREPRVAPVNQSEAVFCAGAYIITRRGAQLMRAVQTPIRFVSDDAFNVAAGAIHGMRLKRPSPLHYHRKVEPLSMRRAVSEPRLAWQDRSPEMIDSGSVHVGAGKAPSPWGSKDPCSVQA